MNLPRPEVGAIHADAHAPAQARDDEARARDDEAPASAIGARERIRRDAPAHVVDVFVYVVVLNLAAEHAPRVITESFTTSLLVALLLKVVLEGVLRAKRWAKGRFVDAETPLGKACGALALVVVMPGSKFVVLEAVAFVFGDAVSLGGFFLVTALIVTLLLARHGVRRLLALPVT